MLSRYQGLLLSNCFRQLFTLRYDHLQLLWGLSWLFNHLCVCRNELLVLADCLGRLILGLVVQLFCLALLHNFVVGKLSHFLALLLKHLDQTGLDHLLLVATLEESLWAEVAWSWSCLQVGGVVSEAARWVGVVTCGIEILRAWAIEWRIVKARIKRSWLWFVDSWRTHCLLTRNRRQEALCRPLVNASFVAASAEHRNILVQFLSLIRCAFRCLCWLSILWPEIASKFDSIRTTWTQLLGLACLKLCLHSNIRLILNIGWVLLLWSS